MADGDQERASGDRFPRAGRPQAPPGYPFSREAAGKLPWSHALRRIEQAPRYWLATTRPDGRPHVTPVWGVWVEGALYFDGHPHTRWARNLAASPLAAVHLESGADVVILEGAVEDLETDADLGRRVIAAWDTKYGGLHPDPATRGIFRLWPRSARAWSQETLEDGTRWQFDMPEAD